MKFVKKFIIGLIPILMTIACSHLAGENFFGGFYSEFQNMFNSKLIPSATAMVDKNSHAQSQATISWSEEVPERLISELIQFDKLEWTSDTQAATFLIHGPLSGREGDLIYQQRYQYYALVAPFPTIIDDVSFNTFLSVWRGEIRDALGFTTLSVNKETYDILSSLWGMPNSEVVHILHGSEIAINMQDASKWAIVPCDELVPRWKVIKINGVSPLDKSTKPDDYPLAISLYLSGKPESKVIWENLQSRITFTGTNRDTAKMTQLVMTGVTALVRATANRMEINGINYPARDIREWLKTADITHISNEVAFIDGCPRPNPNSTSLQFCSDPKYVGLLEYIGADVIEMTGNHLNDYEGNGIDFTLDMYIERGWHYFGGGRNLVDSRKPALFEHNGNRIAFLGCTPADPTSNWATGDHGGAAPCDDYAWMIDAIQSLKKDGYLVVVSIQYFENYSYNAGEIQKRDFQPLADAGAIIVEGSQAHTPKEMEFRPNGSFIHYGLGNLFFDQMFYTLNGKNVDATRYEFIDRYTFYNGNLINIELLTAMLEDYAKPRPMTIEERKTLLDKVFSIATWE